jgi:hypothetical protein
MCSRRIARVPLFIFTGKRGTGQKSLQPVGQAGTSLAERATVIPVKSRSVHGT